MSLLSYKQFQELINTALDYNPRRDRHDGQHPSAEIFTGQGSIVHSLRTKFYIQDDGGSWDGNYIVKPDFIWDMRKISANAVVDDGAAHKGIFLNINNVKETDDGLYFYELENSYLNYSNWINRGNLDFNNTIVNFWITPYPNDRYVSGTVFSLIATEPGIPYQIRLIISIKTDPVNSERFQLRIVALLKNDFPLLAIDRAISSTTAIPFEWEKKYNFQIVFQDLSFKVYANGAVVHSQTISHIFDNPTDFTFIVGQRYRGEISYLTLNSQWTLNSTHLNSLFKYGYPLPRQPEYVDLSDYFEQHGENLLIEVGDIEKAIENIRGQLFVKTSSVKLKDL